MVHDGKHYPKLKLTPVVTGTIKKSLIKKERKERFLKDLFLDAILIFSHRPKFKKLERPCLCSWDL